MKNPEQEIIERMRGYRIMRSLAKLEQKGWGEKNLLPPDQYEQEAGRIIRSPQVKETLFFQSQENSLNLKVKTVWKEVE